MPVGGRRPGAGRKKGVTSKLTADLKQYILETAMALESQGRGLTAWAKENEKDYWTQLFRGVVPRPLEVSGPGGKPIPMKMIVEFAPDPGDQQDVGGG